MQYTSQVVVPGDKVYTLPDSGVVRVGTGLRDDGTHLIAARPGILCQSQGNKFWVFGKQKRYIPSLNDPVIGIISRKQSEFYEVDVGAPFPALLPVLAFEGATRRNRPNLKEGDLVYCRIDMADRDLQPTVTCVDSKGKSADFGPLQGGFTFDCSTLFARALLSQPTPSFLVSLGSTVEFEMVVGVNGRGWVQGSSLDTTLFVVHTLEQCSSSGGNQTADAVVARRLKDCGENGNR